MAKNKRLGKGKALPFFQTKKRIVITLVVILAIGLFSGQKIKSNTQQPQYQTTKVERGTIVSTISGSGQILSANAIAVKTQATGQIATIYVHDGDWVTAGQKIAEIIPDMSGQQKSAAAWASYLAAQNTLNAAQAKMNLLQSALFKANQTFVNDKGVSNPSDEQKADPKYIEENAEWLQAEADYKNQAGVIAAAQATLSNAWLSYQFSSPIISAPVTGTIGDLTIAQGMVIAGSSTDSTTTAASQKVAVIRSEGTPLGSFNISEVDVAKVKKDQKVTITLDSLPGKTFTGKVVGIDKTGVVSSGVTNYPATVQFDVEAPEILSNMAASANIIIETRNDVLVIPSSALRTQGGQTVARMLRNGREVDVPLEVGIASDTQTEVIFGVSERDEVITGTISQSATSQGGFSPFGATPFGGGGLRPGGFGGGGSNTRR